jgi:hypothetical protein
MSFVSDLQDRKITIGKEIKALTASAAGGTLNTSGQGTTADHVGYKDGLYRELDNINKLLASAGGVAEVTSEAIG